MRVATPVPSEYCEINLKNYPVDPSVSGDLCEQQVLSQQIQIYRKTFVKRQGISSQDQTL